MFFIDLILAFVMALFFIGIIAIGFGRPASLGTYTMLFILLMLAILAGGNWIVPMGVPIHGYHWFSFFIVGFLVSLLILALMPALRPPRNLSEAEQKTRRDAVAILAFDFFFGITILVLAAIIVFSYI